MKHLEWKGDKDAGYFIYWNKEAREEKKYDLSLFNIREIKYTIKGFQVYSNDITNFSEEKFTVRNKAGVLVEGLYKDIKEKLPSIEAKLHIKIVSDEVTLYFKGMNYFNINGILKLEPAALKFTGFTNEGKAIKYRAPTFEPLFESVPYDNSVDISVDDLPF